MLYVALLSLSAHLIFWHFNQRGRSQKTEDSPLARKLSFCNLFFPAADKSWRCHVCLGMHAFLSLTHNTSFQSRHTLPLPHRQHHVTSEYAPQKFTTSGCMCEWDRWSQVYRLAYLHHISNTLGNLQVLGLCNLCCSEHPCPLFILYAHFVTLLLFEHPCMQLVTLLQVEQSLLLARSGQQTKS